MIDIVQLVHFMIADLVKEVVGQPKAFLHWAGGGGHWDMLVLTIFGYHTHPDPRFENPKVLFGKIPEINTLIRLEVECEFASIPG